jgi:hypothetical protein
MKQEVRFFISSLDCVEDAAEVIRNEWYIESQHNHMDTDFGDDANETTRDRGAKALQVMKKLVLMDMMYLQCNFSHTALDSFENIMYRSALNFCTGCRLLNRFNPRCFSKRASA